MRRKPKHPVKKIAIDIAGFGLLLIAPFVSLLPGPGGLPVFIAGLGILALNYDWAHNLLKNFDQKYQEFVNKYLVTNKRVAKIVDLLCVITMATGLLIVLTAEGNILRLFGIGTISFGTFILISNQNRLQRLINKIRQK